jgi:hypothetical protein
MLPDVEARLCRLLLFKFFIDVVRLLNRSNTSVFDPLLLLLLLLLVVFAFVGEELNGGLVVFGLVLACDLRC